MDLAVHSESINQQPNIVFLFQDTQGTYAVNIDNVSFDPSTSNTLLEGTVVSSNYPTLTVGSHASIFLERADSSLKDFPISRDAQTNSI